MGEGEGYKDSAALVLGVADWNDALTLHARVLIYQCRPGNFNIQFPEESERKTIIEGDITALRNEIIIPQIRRVSMIRRIRKRSNPIRLIRRQKNLHRPTVH